MPVTSTECISEQRMSTNIGTVCHSITLIQACYQALQTSASLATCILSFDILRKHWNYMLLPCNWACDRQRFPRLDLGLGSDAFIVKQLSAPSTAASEDLLRDACQCVSCLQVEPHLVIWWKLTLIHSLHRSLSREEIVFGFIKKE